MAAKVYSDRVNVRGTLVGFTTTAKEFPARQQMIDTAVALIDAEYGERDPKEPRPSTLTVVFPSNGDAYLETGLPVAAASS